MCQVIGPKSRKGETTPLLVMQAKEEDLLSTYKKRGPVVTMVDRTRAKSKGSAAPKVVIRSNNVFIFTLTNVDGKWFKLI